MWKLKPLKRRQIPTETITQSYYQCHICQKIERNPLEVPCCKHWYCAYCLMPNASMSTSDPTIPDSSLHKCAFSLVDLEYFGISTYLSPPREWNYNRMRVNCPLQCRFGGPLFDVVQHSEYPCTKCYIRFLNRDWMKWNLGKQSSI